MQACTSQMQRSVLLIVSLVHTIGRQTTSVLRNKLTNTPQYQANKPFTRMSLTTLCRYTTVTCGLH